MREEKEKDFVTFEVAKLLQKKGYNKYQTYHYFTEDVHFGDGGVIKAKALTKMFHLSDDFDELKVYAPTLWDAAKWLRQEHALSVEPGNAGFEDEWKYRIFNIATGKEFKCDKNFSSFEEALNKGIAKALKLI